MEVEQVVKKILADAKDEADKIAEEARQKEKVEQAAFDETLTDYRERTSELIRQAAEDEKSHVLAAARMEIAKASLADKRQILDAVFDQAREKLRTLPDDDYRSLMVKLMIQAVETGEEEVLVDKNEKRIDQSLIDEVNRQLVSAGKGSLKLSDEKLAIDGGFVLRRGRIKNNVSFDVLLDQAREDLEIDLAKELFS